MGTHSFFLLFYHQVGETPTAEDNERCLLSIMEAKKIDPNNESVTLSFEHLPTEVYCLLNISSRNTTII